VSGTKPDRLIVGMKTSAKISVSISVARRVGALWQALLEEGAPLPPAQSESASKAPGSPVEGSRSWTQTCTPAPIVAVRVAPGLGSARTGTSSQQA
jgi:hypothetical protein